MKNTVYILLGANLGKPISQVEQAHNLIVKKIGNIIASSSIYESEAWGVEDQPTFMNRVVVVETLFSAENCLHKCQEIELELGRVRHLKWGARVIDVDILYFNNAIIETETLNIPHPYIHLRNFTLLPLVEVAPDYIHPVFNKSNSQMLLESEDKLLVKQINKEDGV